MFLCKVLILSGFEALRNRSQTTTCLSLLIFVCHSCLIKYNWSLKTFIFIFSTFNWCYLKSAWPVSKDITQKSLYRILHAFKHKLVKISKVVKYARTSNTSDTIDIYTLAINCIRFGPQSTPQKGSYHQSITEEQHMPDVHSSRY